MRPLIANIELVDAVKVVDVLERENIQYYTNLEAKMISIQSLDMDQARIALARAGIVINYPEVYTVTDPESACMQLEVKMEQAHDLDKSRPAYEQPWFARLVRLVMGTVIIIVFITTVVRPLLRELLYPGEKQD
ncbi:hypothetical protein ACMZOO_02660 [Catenovulum sp. SX2]|uniref:hypothetical protein n=1 Tax=Catenovulum sp. SX2 TaxID=3398614 RepID=UPI003F847D07